MRFFVGGMTCSACASKVENSVKRVDGVNSCAVSLLTNSMQVEGDFEIEKIISAVKKAGYSATAEGQKRQPNRASEVKRTVVRLAVSAVFLILLMYVSMGHVMLSFWLPDFLTSPLALAICEMALALIIMIINNRFFINGVKGVIHLAPNMDTLVSLGSFASFAYSTVFFICQYVNGKSFIHELYFESAGMILVLVTVGKLLESISKGKTTSALEQLKSLSPQTATLYVDGKERVVDISEIKVGDIVVVKPGESFSVDGVIESGSTTVDESSLTGESLPRDKKEGDDVFTATINLSGLVYVRATSVGEGTNFAKIIQMVEQSATSKAPIAKIADKVASVFVPIVLGIALITIAGHLIASATIGFALARGISVLVISCPCALGLATPVAIMVGSGVGAKSGILFKNAEALENAGKIKVVALDKTGTLTKGQMSVTDILPSEVFTEKEVLAFACALENGSIHPIAQAVLTKGEELNVELEKVLDFEELAGNGVMGKIGGVNFYLGKQEFISTKAEIESGVKDRAEKLLLEGKTVIFISTDNDFIGALGVADTIKESAVDGVLALKEMGVKTVMLTGDNEMTANAVASGLNVDAVYGGLLPDKKGDIISNLKSEGLVGMVGDGINDALALTKADVGIAIGAGTDVAKESASVVLLRDNVSDIASAIKLSKNTIRVIKQNLFWAFCYNAVGIPLASGVLSPLGFTLSPMFGSLCMSISSILVVLNALRLNLLPMSKKGKKQKSESVELKVKGLMCHHCEKTVVGAVSKAFGVQKVSADYKQGIVKITHTGSDLNLIKLIIQNKGYEVEE